MNDALPPVISFARGLNSLFVKQLIQKQLIQEAQPSRTGKSHNALPNP